LRQCGLRNDLMLARAKNACRAWAVASARSAGSARYYYIFLILQKTYIHIYNLYSILKTSEHNVLLVRQLHPVYLVLHPWGHGFELHLLHRFLIFYADLIKWFDGLTAGPAQSAGWHDVPGQSCGPRASGPPLWANVLARHSQHVGMTCLGQSCGPGVWAAVWPSIDVHRVNLK
jgi:hypothetical protein